MRWQQGMSHETRNRSTNSGSRSARGRLEASSRDTLTRFAETVPAHDSDIARTVWAEMVRDGDADGLALRFKAFTAAAGCARMCALIPGPKHQDVATSEIAGCTGFRRGPNCRRRWDTASSASWLERLADDSAAVKRLRDELFDPMSPVLASIRATSPFN